MLRNTMTMLALFSLLAAGPSLAAPHEAPPSVHQEALEAHRHLPLPRHVLPARETLAKARRASMSRVVYGYYPYWTQDLAAIRWSALTHLAWFAIEMDQDGDLINSHGWPDEETVATAHAAGVRVDLSFTLFSGSGIKTLCGDPARRSRAIGNMVDAMEAGGADGISVDFEGLSDGTRDDFTTFIRELRQELDSRDLPGAEISIAGPAVDWNAQFDLDALLDAADWYFIMGYGYFWSGSSRAGPTGILRTPADWIQFQTRSMLRTLAEYSRLIPAAKRHQIIHGVPYYGREWVTASDALGAAVISHVGSVTYTAAQADLSAGQVRRWAPGVSNPWYAWQEQGQWHQVWYDDEESLAAKYDLILDQDLGGVGIWALNYDKPYAALWDLLEDRFAAEPDSWPLGHRLNPVRVTGNHLEDAADLASGPGSYFNFYSCNTDLAEYGREFVYQWDLCQAGVLSAHVPDEDGVDPDLQLLEDLDQDACLDRAHTDLEVDLEPGRYWLVVDTYVDGGLELTGPFTLIADFVPAAGAEPCAAHLLCQAGECVCEQAGRTDCGEACVDLMSDAANCGSCGNLCPPPGVCEAGVCQADQDGGQDGASDGGVDGGAMDGGDESSADGGEKDLSSGGCACDHGGPPAAPLGLLILALWFLGRITRTPSAMRRRRQATGDK